MDVIDGAVVGSSPLFPGTAMRSFDSANPYCQRISFLFRVLSVRALESFV